MYIDSSFQLQRFLQTINNKNNKKQLKKHLFFLQKKHDLKKLFFFHITSWSAWEFLCFPQMWSSRCVCTRATSISLRPLKRGPLWGFGALMRTGRNGTFCGKLLLRSMARGCQTAALENSLLNSMKLRFLSSKEVDRSALSVDHFFCAAISFFRILSCTLNFLFNCSLLWLARNYASLSSWEAYMDRQLTTNFEIELKFFVCHHCHVSIWWFQNRVCPSVCPSVSTPR